MRFGGRSLWQRGLSHGSLPLRWRWLAILANVGIQWGSRCALVWWRLDPGVREDVGRQLSIDNNASERAMRSVAIGRKNGMFVGSVPAGRRAAVLMTLIASCKANLMEPWAWLRDVLTQMPRGVSLQSLLPHTWLKTHAEQWTSHFLANAPREEHLQKLNVK